MKLVATVNSLENTKSNTHVFGVFEGNEKNASELLKQLASDDVFKGKKGTAYFVRGAGKQSPNLLFVGIGKAAEATAENFRVAGAHLFKKIESEKLKDAAIILSSFANKDLQRKLQGEKSIAALAEGTLLSSYNFEIYKSEKTKAVAENIFFVADPKKSLAPVEKALDTARKVNAAINIARDLSNEPGSVLVPMELAKRAQQIAKDYKLSCKILDQKELVKEKMGGILGVGQGSVNPPCLIVLEYKPKVKAKKTVALVGKGITFDSGGISLKPGANMEDMKHDMSGAANVLAAIALASALGSKNHIVCVVAAAENLPSGNAIVPSTILTARSGKTVEVQNTDAEGRLVLMDALDYAQDFKPHAVIDVATLTGAVVMALSNVAAGIMGNDKGLMNQFKEAAHETEEKFWELPLYQEYSDDIKSKIADIKNIGSAGSGAGSQKGGVFLKEFIRKDTKWIHVDIAGIAWNVSHLPYQPKHGASGQSVRTLTQFSLDF